MSRSKGDYKKVANPLEAVKHVFQRRNPIETVRGAVRRRRIERCLSDVETRLEEDHNNFTPEQLLRVDGPGLVFNLEQLARSKKERAQELMSEAWAYEAEAARIDDVLINRGLK